MWHDLDLWIIAVEALVHRLSQLRPEEAELFQERGAAYIAELRDLQTAARQILEPLPREKRVLVTSHDAFSYFGRAYGFETRSILGISTEDEAGVRDVQDLARLIVERGVEVLFYETAIDRRSMVALQEAVQARGSQIRIAPAPLFAGTLGTEGPARTFLGAYRQNVETIAAALLGDS
ncbi:hypothetical protein AU468_14460 [Alkalispirochaeta sphaeroplastigenens]|uniref:ABC transporter substrate-binding protein n=1 Tax=Alkalispirochaeta sphaeroplastigenens TaxID=1187066 RepID=A0A2S4JFD1_9SPIO|nr:hypothetical protein AU468_14460 [Alkalispirochaeta sphaeroplastigenens]